MLQANSLLASNDVIAQEDEMIKLYYGKKLSPYEIAKRLNIRKTGNNHIDADGVLYVIEQTTYADFKSVRKTKEEVIK